MKIFQNPYVVGGLVLAAGAFIYLNNVRPMLKRNASGARPPAAQPAAPAAAPAVQAATPEPVKSADPAPENPAAQEMTKIELARVGWDANGSPPRDPFQLSGSIAPPARLGPPVGEVLRLTAIWRQTGQSLAVIDGQIMAKGGVIKEYTIEEIENQRVWVTGPAGRESLGFVPVVSVEGKPVLTGASNSIKAASTP
jgi:hypothetical protein